MAWITCCKCGVQFFINDEHNNRLYNNGDTFFCTNGHAQHYTYKETEIKKLQTEIKELQNSIYRKDERIKRLVESRDSFYRSINSYKGVITKLKRRLNGK